MPDFTSVVEAGGRILPEGRGHGVPESQNQRDAGVGFLSTWERPHVPVDVEAGTLAARVRVDFDGESRGLVVELQLPDVLPGAE